jgi:hypothetical protein
MRLSSIAVKPWSCANLSSSTTPPGALLENCPASKA